MTIPCSPLTVIEVGGQNITITEETGTDPVLTTEDETFIGPGDVTCCNDAELPTGAEFSVDQPAREFLDDFDTDTDV